MHRSFHFLRQIRPVVTSSRSPNLQTALGIAIRSSHNESDNLDYLSEQSQKTKNFAAEQNRRYHKLQKSLEPIKRIVLNEIGEHSQEGGCTVPESVGSHLYQYRYEDGANLPSLFRCRTPASYQPEKEWQGAKRRMTKVLDLVEEADETGFVSVDAISVTRDGRYLGFLKDASGEEFFDLHLRDQEESKEESLPDVSGFAWVKDKRGDRFVVYTTPDELMRPWRVCVHKVGSDADNDVTILEDHGPSNFLKIHLSKDGKYVFLNSNSKVSSEVHILYCDDPWNEPQLLLSRQQEIQYFVSHRHGKFYMVTNRCDGEYNIMYADAGSLPLQEEHLETFYTPEEGELLEDMDVFDSHIVLVIRSRGQHLLRIIQFGKGAEVHTIQSTWTVPFLDNVFSLNFGMNLNNKLERFRCETSNMLGEERVYDILPLEKKVSLLRTTTVSGCDSSSFSTERVMVRVDSDTEVPLTILSLRDVDGPKPVLVQVYGAYGVTLEPSYDNLYLPLLRRGWSICLAHVRGGGELGRAWYKAGTATQKMNSVTDFIACCNYLVQTGLTRKGMLAAMGTSAGGIPVAAACNMTGTDLFGAVILDVPYLDLLRAMDDPNLPLTVHEFDEFGDPRDSLVRRYIAQYDPVLNVGPHPYPHMLLYGDLHDRRVPYWHPLRYAAKVQREKDGICDNVAVVNVSSTTGHSADGGRFSGLEKTAEQVAFLLKYCDGGGKT